MYPAPVRSGISFVPAATTFLKVMFASCHVYSTTTRCDIESIHCDLSGYLIHKLLRMIYMNPCRFMALKNGHNRSESSRLSSSQIPEFTPVLSKDEKMNESQANDNKD
jgi:hypothetical protein